MPVSESTKIRFENIWSSNWASLTAKSGLNAWMDFIDDIETDDKSFSLAFDELLSERQEKQKFHRLNDRPSLNEFKWYYYKKRREERADTRTAEESVNCTYCENQGRRYIVVHSESTTGVDEDIITKVPEINDIRRFCYNFSIPCTCPKGVGVFRNTMRNLQINNPINQERQREILTNSSFVWRDAARLMHSYSQWIKYKFYGVPINNEPTAFTEKIQKAIKSIANCDTGESKYARKKPVDMPESAYENHGIIL